MLQSAGYREYRDYVTGYLLPVAGEYKIQDQGTGNGTWYLQLVPVPACLFTTV
ncbi:hypothetical protein [Niastella sp. OAS944]|uniref:hypothetical protein n=1 Tax=Niastella sp. OAS944 TaxID=2664089 RepID=UPI003495A9E7|nr:hypothetical protein [Chitinophagaceae bacterium OAS944]